MEDWLIFIYLSFDEYETLSSSFPATFPRAVGDTEVAVGGSCHYLVRRGEEGMHARRTPPAPTARWDRSVQGRQSGQALAIHSFPGR